MAIRLRTPEALWSLSRCLHRNGAIRLARAIKTLNWLIHKCLLPAEAEVGHDVVLEHYAMGVVIHPQVRIGKHCRIYHHVTLASESCIDSDYRIILEDGVTIGAHAIVVGRGDASLIIGRGSIVGAGSVLTKDVPPGEVWVGNPAKFLRRNATEK